MSYPTRLDLFRKWSRAMEQGAKVDKPNYSPASTTKSRPTRKRRMRRKRFHRKRKKED